MIYIQSFFIWLYTKSPLICYNRNRANGLEPCESSILYREGFILCCPSTSEWTAFHPKSPAEWLGISHTAPSFLLSAKSHARLACSVAVACKATSPITTARCRYQLFADLCLAALEIHFVSPLQQEEYRARQRAMLFFYPLCQGTRILPVQNADRRTNKGKGTVAQCMNIHRD